MYLFFLRTCQFFAKKNFCINSYHKKMFEKILDQLIHLSLLNKMKPFIELHKTSYKCEFYIKYQFNSFI
jgi:hypothetical protein